MTWVPGPVLAARDVETAEEALCDPARTFRVTGRRRLEFRGGTLLARDLVGALQTFHLLGIRIPFALKRCGACRRTMLIRPPDRRSRKFCSGACRSWRFHHRSTREWRNPPALRVR